jgi:hypothetical protein
MIPLVSDKMVIDFSAIYRRIKSKDMAKGRD